MTHDTVEAFLLAVIVLAIAWLLLHMALRTWW